MLYAQIKENSLICFSSETLVDGGEPFSFTDRDFLRLFDFAALDVGDIASDLAAFFRMRVDPDSLAPMDATDEAQCADLINGIEDKLACAHPFFATDDHRSSAAYMLAGHLNSLLSGEGHPLLDENDYRELLLALVSPALRTYRERNGALSSMYDGLLFSHYQYREYIEQKERGKKYHGSGLAYLSYWQRYLRCYLYWVLDSVSTRFKGMDINSRGRLFHEIFDFSDSDLSIRPREIFTFASPHTGDERMLIETESHRKLLNLFLNRPEGMAMDETESETERILNEHKSKQEKEMLRRYDSRLFAEVTDDDVELGPDLMQAFNAAKKKAMDAKKPPYQAYEVEHFHDLVHLQLKHLVLSGSIVRRCENCGMYFIAGRTNNEYCPRVIEGNTAPCATVGPKKRYAEHLETDIVKNLYGKIYRRQQARNRRGTLSDEAFDKWRGEARKRVDYVNNGKWTEEQFTDWINASSDADAP